MNVTASTTPDITLPSVATWREQQFIDPAVPPHRARFEKMLTHHVPRFRQLAMRWLRNREDAEDAVQEALFLAFEHIDEFHGRAQLSTWVTAIVINSVRMQLRRRGRRQMVSLENGTEDGQWTFSELFADSRPSPEDVLRERELIELVARLARGLPPLLRVAFELRQCRGLSTKDAAGALGVPEGTLKARLARGRANLVKRFRQATGRPKA